MTLDAAFFTALDDQSGPAPALKRIESRAARPSSQRWTPNYLNYWSALSPSDR
jgi:hypothetical protein